MSNMKKLIIIMVLFTACSKKSKERVCEYPGGIIIDKKDWVEKIGDMYYYIQMPDGTIEGMEAHQIDYNYKLGDTIKPCK